MAALETLRLRQLAKDAGFELVGFARAEAIPPETLRDWVAQGFHADMGWFQEQVELRLDVTRLLPGAKTVMALACNHYPGDEVSPIARYARGRDYHLTLRDRIRALRRAVREQFPGVNDYGSVDANPLMEKVWAARAGLGYVGRNGCFITEEFGSWVSLAAMVLDAEVDVYAAGPAVDRCGTCNLCVSACPTSAIVADATVDARKCLSYWTIEAADVALPEAMANAMADLGFGCDVCQEVCPLNDAPVKAIGRFEPRPISGKSLLELAALGPEEFKALAQGTPLMRAKYDGVRRNAAYALGAGRVAEARPLLEKLSADANATVAAAAKWALARLA